MKRMPGLFAFAVTAYLLFSCQMNWYANSDGTWTDKPKLPTDRMSFLYDGNGVTGSTAVPLPGVSLYYSIDGSDPDRSGTPIIIDADPPDDESAFAFFIPTGSYPSVIRFRGIFVKDGWLDTSVDRDLAFTWTKCAAPSVSAYYNSAFGLNATMSVADSGVTIRWTSDGSDPTVSSPIWSATGSTTISGNASTILKARGFKLNFSPSDVVIADILDLD